MNHNRYEHMLHLPPPTSKRHPRMSLYARGAQFAPFAALTGHEDAVKETARLTNPKLQLSEDRLIQLNEKLHKIEEVLAFQPEVSITYFIEDQKKSGGSYVTYKGIIKKIDDYQRVIVMMDQTKIFIDQIIEIDSEIFQTLF